MVRFHPVAFAGGPVQLARWSTAAGLVAQSAEHCPVTAAVVGASPIGTVLVSTVLSSHQPEAEVDRHPATNRECGGSNPSGLACATVAQLAEAAVSETVQCRFESCRWYSMSGAIVQWQDAGPSTR